jgi:Tol biopolymer transport system component
VVGRPSYDERLYVTEVATKKRFALTSQRARHPSWIDDNNIAYLEDMADGRTEVRLADVAAGVMPLKLAEFPVRAAWIAVHPSRRTIAAVLATADGGQRIVLRALDGREPDRTLAEGAEYTHLRWLPDGSALSWSGPERASDHASNGVWSVGIGEAEPRRLVADAYGPVWSRDGSTVYFSRIRDRAGLWSLDVRHNAEALVRSWPEGNYEFDIAGDRLLFTREQGRGRIYAMSLPR